MKAQVMSVSHACGMPQWSPNSRLQSRTNATCWHLQNELEDWKSYSLYLPSQINIF